MGEPYSLNMIYATIFLALILILCIARIYFLNSEVKELEIAAGKLSNRIDQWSSGTEKGGVAVTHEMPKELRPNLSGQPTLVTQRRKAGLSGSVPRLWR
jgi:hypothetical protein